jgi:hypothetical protein
MAGRYNQDGTVQEEVCPYSISWPAGCSQSLSYYTRRRQHPQEENTIEVREEPATVDIAGPKQ